MARGRPRKVVPEIEEKEEVTVVAPPSLVYRLKISYHCRAKGAILPAGSVVSLSDVPADYLECGAVYASEE